ncbi:MAG: AEC family transporter [Anaerolineae bacterium]|nr:AEC family transporter [Anaerolineae bacterium]
MSIPDITYNIILPIFLVVGTAAIADYILDINPHALSRLLVYLFTPALVFHSLATMDIQADEASQLIIGTIIALAIMSALGYGVTRSLHYDRKLEGAFILSVAMINAGNYGIPLNRLAFGDAGEARAILCYVASAIMINSFGVFVASRGSVPTREALLNMFRVPLPYAAALGLLVNATHFDLPNPLIDSMDLAGQAAIPGMLTALGIQLSHTLQSGSALKRLKQVLLASGMKLLVAPVVAVGVALVLGFAGLTRQVFIIEVSMPTAVMSGVLAIEFGSDAEHVTATILVSTLASIITLSVLLSLLM